VVGADVIDVPADQGAQAPERRSSERRRLGCAHVRTRVDVDGYWKWLETDLLIGVRPDRYPGMCG
jgi:hypothetical protein